MWPTITGHRAFYRSVLVATTVRGSPGSGNRAQYVMNWNLRISRQLALPVGRFVATADLLNVTNGAQRPFRKFANPGDPTPAVDKDAVWPLLHRRL